MGRLNTDTIGVLALLSALALPACAEQKPLGPALGQQIDASADAGSDADETLDASEAAADVGLDVFTDAAGSSDAADVVPAPSILDAAAKPVRDAVAVPEGWAILGAGEDPFTDRPPVVSCSPAAVTAELLSTEHVLGVETGGCNYVTASQPSRREVALGETITVRLWHFELSAPEPTEAHAALLIDGIEVLNERISIPQPGGLIVKQVRAERPIPAGARALFHLHNHGANSWALVEVSAGP